MAGYALEIKNVSKAFKGFTALKDVSFNVSEDEVFGLLGPNGAGKSTLISIISCLTRLGSGDVKIFGISVNEPKKLKRLIGLAPQENSLYENLTVHQNLQYFASLYGVGGKELGERADMLLQLFFLTDKKNSLVKELSGGMKRRLNMACAVIHYPKLLILDEPTAGLDPVTRRAEWEIIKSLREVGVTILITTHYMEEAELLCDRVAIMDKGSVIVAGTPSELKAQVGREVIKIRSIPGNFIELGFLSEIMSIPGVKEASRAEDTLLVNATNPKFVIPLLLKLFADKEEIVLEATIVKPSLEDVFIKLTGTKIA